MRPIEKLLKGAALGRVMTHDDIISLESGDFVRWVYGTVRGRAQLISRCSEPMAIVNINSQGIDNKGRAYAVFELAWTGQSATISASIVEGEEVFLLATPAKLTPLRVRFHGRDNCSDERR